LNRLRTLRAQFLVECLGLPRATGIEDARWEYFQLAHLNDDSTFRIEDKSRQIAWSWLAAAEGIADAILDERDSIYVSINLEEAKEKIRYARRIYDALQIGGLPRLITDNQLELEFDNHARLTSLPSKPPRGRARSNVFLDEFAHVQHDRQIYTAALPVISKGGRLRIGSSPFGASGVFWEVFTQAMQAYPGYTRKSTPWWEVQSFCLNVAEARKLAPAMETFERVDLFGNDRIKALFANMLLEDFQQEYEAEFVDETTAWISWEEIKTNQDAELLCAMAVMRGSCPQNVHAAIAQVARWIEEGKIERVLDAGVDIGRTRNATECFLVGESTTKTYPLRLALTLDNVEFDDQKDVLTLVLKSLPIAKMLIDQNGIGRNLAENLSRSFPVKVQGVNFTNETKKLWATDTKMLMQQRKTPLPADRDIAYQIHSIKKLVSPSKNLIFDTDRNEKHHADKFWALALALAGAIVHESFVPEDENAYSYGYREY
jgi:phage FluMu gp28-like protein